MGLTLAITVAGALTGCLLFPVGGFLFGYDLGFMKMAGNGFMDGGFLAFIWAPGISFVVCVIMIKNKFIKNADYHS